MIVFRCGLALIHMSLYIFKHKLIKHPRMHLFAWWSRLNSLHIPTNRCLFPQKSGKKTFYCTQIKSHPINSLSFHGERTKMNYNIPKGEHWRIFPCRTQINPKSRLCQTTTSEPWIKVWDEQLLKYHEEKTWSRRARLKEVFLLTKTAFI